MVHELVAWRVLRRHPTTGCPQRCRRRPAWNEGDTLCCAVGTALFVMVMVWGCACVMVHVGVVGSGACEAQMGLWCGVVAISAQTKLEILVQRQHSMEM